MEERTSIHIQEQKQKLLTPHPSLGGKIAKISPTHAVSLISGNVNLRQGIKTSNIGFISSIGACNFMFEETWLKQIVKTN